MREFSSHLLLCLFVAGVVFREISKGYLAFSVLLFTISGVDRLYVYKRPSWGRSKIPMTAFTALVPQRGAVSPPIGIDYKAFSYLFFPSNRVIQLI